MEKDLLLEEIRKELISIIQKDNPAVREIYRSEYLFECYQRLLKQDRIACYTPKERND